MYIHNSVPCSWMPPRSARLGAGPKCRREASRWRRGRILTASREREPGAGDRPQPSPVFGGIHSPWFGGKGNRSDPESQTGPSARPDPNKSRGFHTWSLRVHSPSHVVGPLPLLETAGATHLCLDHVSGQRHSPPTNHDITPETAAREI